MFSRLAFIVSIFSFLMMACGHGGKSTRLGWDYNDPKYGGFQSILDYEQECPPNMVLLDGGEWCSEENDTLYSYDIRPFFISKHEETNGQYLQYLSFLNKYYPGETYEDALPDTMAWLRDSTLELNERSNLMQLYLRHPAYENYPVVGLSEAQIERYAIWKTDRLNEYILIREEAITPILEAEKAHRVFTTKAYYANQYHPSSDDKEQQLIDLDPSRGWRKCKKSSRVRIIRLEDAILYPTLRLPTEGEQKWAMMSMMNKDEKSIHSPKEMKVKSKYVSITPIPQVDIKIKPSKDVLYGKEIALSSVFTKDKSDLYFINSNVDEVVRTSIDTTYLEKKTHQELYAKCVDLMHLDNPDTGTTSPIQLKGFRLVMDHVSLELTKKELRK